MSTSDTKTKSSSGCCGGSGVGGCGVTPSEKEAGACCGKGSCSNGKEEAATTPSSSACGGGCGPKESATSGGCCGGSAKSESGGCCKGGAKDRSGCCGGSEAAEEVFDPNKPLTESMKAKLDGIIRTAEVMIFIKGTPQEPKCKFSKALIRFLMDNNVTKFGYFDILSDSNVREALKMHSNWKTYPQLYIAGRLIGGLDVVKELHSDDAFLNQIPAAALGKGLFPRIRTLVDSKPVMLFLQGTPDAPESKEGEAAVKVLKAASIEFGFFNVSSDASIMNGLKQYGHVHTYPQLWLKSDVVSDFASILAGTAKRTLTEVFAPPPPTPAKSSIPPTTTT